MSVPTKMPTLSACHGFWARFRNPKTVLQTKPGETASSLKVTPVSAQIRPTAQSTDCAAIDKNLEAALLDTDARISRGRWRVGIKQAVSSTLSCADVVLGHPIDQRAKFGAGCDPIEAHKRQHRAGKWRRRCR